MENTGDTASDPQTVGINAPDGITLTGGSASTDPPPALRRFSTLFEPADAPSDPPLDCHDGTCTYTYTVPPHSTLAVTLALKITPAAQPGDITLVINKEAAGKPLKVTVEPGLTALSVSTPVTDWKAGTTVRAELTGTVANNKVTDIGAITLPVRNEDAWITRYPTNCKATSGAAAAISCSIKDQIDSEKADFGEFGISLLPGASGAQTIEATRPGDHPPLALTGLPDAAAPVDPLAPGDPITMTGPFGGAMVGSPAIHCPGRVRLLCFVDHKLWGTMAKSVPLPALPDGGQLVAARLTWAVSTRTVPSLQTIKNLSTLSIKSDSGSSSIEGIALPPVVNVPGNDRNLTQWSADVTDQIGGQHTIASTDLIDGKSTITVTDLGTKALEAHAHMAAWTLALMWADPDTGDVTAVNSTVSLDSTLASLVTEGGKTWTMPEPATADPVESLAVALWGVDDIPHKTVAVGGSPVLRADRGKCTDRDPSSLVGLIPNPDRKHIPLGCAAVGFDLAALDSPASAPDGPDVGPVTVTTGNDRIWVGAALVVRTPSPAIHHAAG